MFLGFTNTIARLNSYIYLVLSLIFDTNIIIYQNDILLILLNFSESKEHFWEELEAYVKFGSYAKLKKYLFSIDFVHFLDSFQKI